MSRLRALLEPDAALIARGGGYVINVDPRCLDARRFEQLVAAGPSSAGPGLNRPPRPAVSGRRWRCGAARRWPTSARWSRWRWKAARLEELRLAAIEGRVEADLALGLHAELAGELESLVAQHPLRERLWRLLVLALYRGERQADALAAYRRARAMLAADLGLEPGEELRRLEQAGAAAGSPGAAAAPSAQPARAADQLRGPRAGLAALEQLLSQARRLITLTGRPGWGRHGWLSRPRPSSGSGSRRVCGWPTGQHRRPWAGGGAGDGGAGSTAGRRDAGDRGTALPAALCRAAARAG